MQPCLKSQEDSAADQASKALQDWSLGFRENNTLDFPPTPPGMKATWTLAGEATTPFPGTPFVNPPPRGLCSLAALKRLFPLLGNAGS